MDRTTDDEVLDAVGPRLRALRRDRGITLADLATTTGVSESTLSRLENGQRRPTLELLLPLARTYNVPLDDLVGAPRTGDPRVHLKPVSRFGITFVPLSRRRARRRGPTASSTSSSVVRSMRASCHCRKFP
ncbi:helix-turn-helix domain-containing protein, partial [Streptomyces clavuligerus]|uniref:helix-turn-helix domain-containing protein n=1 Tax=Streptomyces clavuligerus TaxID=1901 RepID=UPI001E29F0A6